VNKHYKEFLFFPDISILIALNAVGFTIALMTGLTMGMMVVFFVGLLTFAFSEYFKKGT
jgi:hypothetical protein